jgi:hypothetical protein
MNNLSHQSTISSNDIQEFLQSIDPFHHLSTIDLQSVVSKMRPLRFRMGQKMLIKEQLPSHILVIFSGKVRLVGIEPVTNQPVSLQVLAAGGLLGWVSLIRQIPCETALASEETICFVLPAAEFMQLLPQQPLLATGFDTPHLSETFDLVTRYWQHQDFVAPKDQDDELGYFMREIWQSAIVTDDLSARPEEPIDQLWFDSKAELAILGTPITTNPQGSDRRLVGISQHLLIAGAVTDRYAEADDVSVVAAELVEYAPDLDFQVTNTNFGSPTQLTVENRGGKFPAVRGQGLRDGVLACFQMLSMYLGIKYRRETVQRIVDMQLSRKIRCRYNSVVRSPTCWD